MLINNDEVGLILDSEGEPQLLGTGWHVIFPMDTFIGKKKLTDPYIAVGNLKIISVNKGEVSYCIDTATGQQMLLTEGRHVLHSATLICKGFINFNDPSKLYGHDKRTINQIEDSDLRIIRVETGQKGILNRAGKLEMLDPGLHVIAPPDKFSGLLATTQQIIELKKTMIESSDYVPLNIQADVFYSITNPLKALTEIGSNIIKFITDKAKATITGIIRSQSYMAVAQDCTSTYAHSTTEEKQVSQVNSSGYINPPPSAPRMTVRTVHDAFMEQINDEVMRRYGIEISNIRIESMEIASEDLAREFAAQAKMTAEKQTKIINLHAQAQIQEQAARNAAETKKIEANATCSEADAKAYAIEKEANARAQAVVTMAEADKKHVILEGQGKQAFADSIKDPVAQRLAFLELQMQALRNARVSFTQVPSGFSQAPFGLFSPVPLASVLPLDEHELVPISGQQLNA